jgi:hypothetical protein
MIDDGLPAPGEMMNGSVTRLPKVGTRMIYTAFSVPIVNGKEQRGDVRYKWSGVVVRTYDEWSGDGGCVDVLRDDTGNIHSIVGDWWGIFTSDPACVREFGTWDAASIVVTYTPEDV